ncbi:MAG: aldolase/citrate lyase family protein [Desulfobacterales bacterium]|jgi:2-dehydro-3-deoxyglucarate aldolase/4-hydroxy-2-oxoheptanedioate aldolase|nr:aldolase/citrate lyase family protein [Desulfobacterales bacterium]
MLTDFKTRLTRGDVFVGTFICLPSPESAELFAELGYDWLIIDTEHGPYDVLTAQRMLQAVGRRCPCVVRVPSNEEVWIKKALDIGAAGVLVPLVNSPEIADRVQRACRYAPEGTRGMGGARAHRYGAGFQDYVACANREIAAIVQAEHIEAVNHIEAIAAVPGIDAIFVGPYDLSASMGKPGRIQDSEVQAAIRKVRDATLKAGLKLGIYCSDPESARSCIRQGYTLIGMSTDLNYLTQSAMAALASAKRE